MKEFISNVLFIILFFIGAFIWFWGVPYLFTFPSDLPYSFFAAIWLSIHLVRNLIGRIVLQDKLDKYKEIDTIMNGTKNTKTKGD